MSNCTANVLTIKTTGAVNCICRVLCTCPIYQEKQKPQVFYKSSGFWLLGVESRDFSHTEKERNACKAEQIHKMTTVFTQNDNLGPFCEKMVVIL